MQPLLMSISKSLQLKHFNFSLLDKSRYNSRHNSCYRSIDQPAMCYGSEKNDVLEIRPAENENRSVALENLRGRVAETEERLERARAREAELIRQLEEMRKFVSVMEILENYLRDRYAEQQRRLTHLYSSSSSVSVPAK